MWCMCWEKQCITVCREKCHFSLQTVSGNMSIYSQEEESEEERKENCWHWAVGTDDKRKNTGVSHYKIWNQRFANRFFSTYQSCNFPHCCKTEFPMFSWPVWHMWTAVNLYLLFKSDYRSSCQHASVHHACILTFVFAEGNRNQNWLLKPLHLIYNQYQRKWADITILKNADSSKILHVKDCWDASVQ